MGAVYKLSPDYILKDPHFPMSLYPYNYFLQIAAEIGIPGLFIFLLIVFLALKNGVIAVQAKTHNSLFIKACLSGLGLYLITFMIGCHLILPVHQFLFWFIIAGLVLPSLSKSKPALCLAVSHQICIILFFTLLLLTYAFNFIKCAGSSKIYGNYPVELSAPGKPFLLDSKGII